MSEAILSVTFAGPLVTVQDAGRAGNMRFGVARSGPMDARAFDAANAALGNAPGQTGLEVSLGGIILSCQQGAISVAITGGDFAVDHAGQKITSWTIITLQKGEQLAVRAGKAGSWAYLAFAGDLDAPLWLGSHATHSTSGFGGGAVTSGQVLRITNASLRDDRLGDVARPDPGTGPIRVVMGPQDHQFSPQALAQFMDQPFAVSDAYDRMGMRLVGPELALKDALSIPSEPILRGSVQVSGDGVPTVLLADHQTTGGYPKIATVLSCDLDRLVQYRAGQMLRFTPVTPKEAIEIARNYAADTAAYLAQIAVARGSLEQRLMRENLNHGCIYD